MKSEKGKEREIEGSAIKDNKVAFLVQIDFAINQIRTYATQIGC